MSVNSIKSRIQEMKGKYIEAHEDHGCQGDLTCSNLKKAKKIKKKLLALEKERCQCMLENKDLTSINQKIAQLKGAYTIDEGDKHLKGEH